MIPFLTVLRRALPLLAAALFSCGREVDPADPLPSAVTVPQNVKLHGSTETSLTFQWDPVDGAIGFNWKLTRDGAAVSDGSVTSRNVTVSSLEKGTTYAFSVCSVGTSNVSAYSAVVEATTQGTPAPPPGPSSKTVCVDEPLLLQLDKKPVLGSSGLIRVFTTDGTEVDRIDLADLALVTVRDDGVMIPKAQITGETVLNTFMDVLKSGSRYRIVHYTPLRVRDDGLVIRLHSGVLNFGTSYYVTVDESVCGKAVAAGEWNITVKAKPSTLKVAADGSADFCTVQGALNYASTLAKDAEVTVEVGSGTFEEMLFLRDKNKVTVKGASRDATLIRYPNNESYCGGSGASSTSKPTLGKAIGTPGGRGLFLVENCDELTLQDLTIENSFDQQKGQAETIYFNSGNNTHRLTIENCALLSWQDTFLTKGRVWVHKTLIAGHCDYIWGYPDACLFEECEIRSRAAGYIVQARVPSASSKGFVFLNCTLTAESGVKDGSMYLARSGGDASVYDNVVYVNCTLGSVIAAAGWETTKAPNPSTPTATAGWREFGSVDPSGKAVTGHNASGKVLTAEEAEPYSSRAAVLGW